MYVCMSGYRRRDRQAEWAEICYEGVMSTWEECGLGFVGLKHYLHWVNEQIVLKSAFAAQISIYTGLKFGSNG